MRVTQMLARTGLCSRREAERWISEGRVKIGGQIVPPESAPHARWEDVLLDDAPLPEIPVCRLWRFHKPRHCLVTRHDDRGRATIFDLLPSTMTSLVTVGRLDYHSEGLLLLTNDGRLSRFLELPAQGWARCYQVEGEGFVDFERLRRIRSSLTIDGVRYAGAQWRMLTPMDSLTEERSHRIRLLITLHEGKNREVRHLMAYCGISVQTLCRISYGPWRLENLRPSRWREVTSASIAAHIPASIVSNSPPPMEGQE